MQTFEWSCAIRQSIGAKIHATSSVYFYQAFAFQPTICCGDGFSIHAFAVRNRADTRKSLTRMPESEVNARYNALAQSINDNGARGLLTRHEKSSEGRAKVKW
jgi:hypothetical protein